MLKYKIQIKFKLNKVNQETLWKYVYNINIYTTKLPKKQNKKQWYLLKFFNFKNTIFDQKSPRTSKKSCVQYKINVTKERTIVVV